MYIFVFAESTMKDVRSVVEGEKVDLKKHQ